MSMNTTHAIGRLDYQWMPFTANRQFKKTPRMLVSAQGLYYQTDDARDILDATSGLWCCNAGHCHPHIQQAIAEQAATLDYAPSFQMGHPHSFALAERISAYLPENMNTVFFTNSGSESVDTCLKIALAYHKQKGNNEKTLLIGRERGYHGVGFGGISVSGIESNRTAYAPLLPNTDHLKHNHDLSRNAFSRGIPTHGVEYAEDLLRIIQSHEPSTIAAVIVEPVAGSTGVLIPPQGYLQRLRALCDQHDILLIFDEVITGYGRLGSAFAMDYFGVQADLVNAAKGLTSGVIPMGAVFVSDASHSAFMQGPEQGIELFHGYTCSGHPIACAAANACLDVYESEKLFENAASLSDYWQEAMHSFQGFPWVIDVRNIGLMAAIELEPIAGAATQRSYAAFVDAFHKGLLIRVTGDTIALSPPLTFTKERIDDVVSILTDVLKKLQ